MKPPREEFQYKKLHRVLFNGDIIQWSNLTVFTQNPFKDLFYEIPNKTLTMKM